MTNRRHFYSFKTNQNASAQNFPQNPPCPDKPGKPLFLRIHAVRHNNAFCNGRPAPNFHRRSSCNFESIRHDNITHYQSYPGIKLPDADRPTTPSLYGTKMLPFLQNSPGINSRQPIAPKLRLRGTKMLPFLQNSPGINSRQPIAPKLRLHGTEMLPFARPARH